MKKILPETKGWFGTRFEQKQAETSATRLVAMSFTQKQLMACAIRCITVIMFRYGTAKVMGAGAILLIPVTAHQVLFQ